ncbi:DUF4097 domain-containing protein [Tissierella pigra]|uniref:DUF4097 domain-containing protein n=1 Tax=Tissierella pigra TaxID=2607614 RepID=A0A6N7XIY0_9FIRM|nr:DUF4097 family beta strand repeat-containing protein [Tissierella pigra]MBU5425857.1 DUF4097 domain-containing protein [Tissierella pigra]MSU01566.1 DUF4097 domain-containing protein [Tissierella pigra]
MNTKKVVSILAVVVLVAFGVGILSLRYNDNYKFIGSNSINWVNVRSNDEIVKIDEDGIQVKDGDDQVSIGWNGIKVNDGKNGVSIGWDGVKVKDGDEQVSIGLNGVNIKEKNKSFFSNWNWFGINSRNLKWETIDEETQAEITGIDTIIVSPDFIDVKITSEERDDVGIHYYGKMKTNIVPTLNVDKTSNSLDIKLKTNRNNYSVVTSDVILEIFVPKSYNGNFHVTATSGDIYMKGLAGKNFNISSNSGEQHLENLEGNKLTLTATSGDITLKNSIGEVESKSSSGEQRFENVEGQKLDLSASSGDIELKNCVGEIKVSTNSGEQRYKNVEGKKLDLSSTSGDIELEDCIGELKISTNSGHISLDNEKSKENMKLSTSSGDISISLGDNPSYTIQGTTSSGDFITFGNINIQENDKGRFRATIGSGEKSIDISTSSGNVRFSK